MKARIADTVAMAVRHVDEGGIPFAALIVDENGVIVGKGVNRVRELSDPSSHAEVEAIRDAARRTGIPYLHGVTLIASGEPCVMCYITAVFAGVKEIIYVADRYDAAAAGFDYVSTYRLLSTDPKDWEFTKVRRISIEDGLAPFQKFKERFS